MNSDTQSTTHPAELDPSVESCAALARDLERIAHDSYDLIRDVLGRRKLDLHSRAGWYELQDILYSGQFDNRLPAATINTLHLSCRQWLHRYRHLCFVAATRPVWNT